MGSATGADVAGAGAISAVMCGQAYLTSSRVAEANGPFPGYAVNEQPFLEVMRMHRDSVSRINKRNVTAALADGAQQCWDDAYESGRRHGYRSGQAGLPAGLSGRRGGDGGLFPGPSCAAGSGQ